MLERFLTYLSVYKAGNRRVDRDFCVKSPCFLMYQSLVYINNPKKGFKKKLRRRVVGEVKQENLV